MGMLIYHFTIILVSLIINSKIIAMLNVLDMLKMLPGIIDYDI